MHFVAYYILYNIDLSKTKANFPHLEQPKRPEPSDVKPPAEGRPATVSQLSTYEKEQLRQLQSDYNYDRKEYDRKRRALAELRKQIVETIKRSYVSYTHKCDTVHDVAVKLKDRVAPTDKIRERELIEQYKTACKPPKPQNIEQWIQKWEPMVRETICFSTAPTKRVSNPDTKIHKIRVVSWVSGIAESVL